MTFIRRIFLLLALSFVTVASATESVTTEGTVDAPVAEVWAAFTTGDGLRSWMAPHADIDLRVDGEMRANYRAEGTLGDASTIVNRVLSFEPQRMLSIRVTRAPAGFPFPAAIQAMWTVIHFEALADARTRLRVVSMGFTPDDQSQQMKAYFERGNAYTVEKLKERFRK